MKKTKYTCELLGPIVKSSKSISGVLDHLGLKKTGGNYRNISGWIRYNNLDVSHFKGQGWSRGETRKSSESVDKFSRKIELKNNEIFIDNSRYAKGQSIIKRLVRDFGKQYKCEICGLDKWLGENISLHLDHINGVHNDNRVINLRILCPNCHQQTITWGIKKKPVW